MMKMDKKKIVFTSVIVLVVAFIVSYTFLIWGDGQDADKELQSTLVPELPEESEVFESRKVAVDAITENRERFSPSIYDEKLLDSTGRFDPNLLDKEKQCVVDSIYRLGRIDYETGAYRKKQLENTPTKKTSPKEEPVKIKERKSIDLKEMALEQQLFFSVSPELKQKTNEQGFYAIVEGEQTVRVNDRLQLRILEQVELAGITVKKNTRVYGIVRFQPNRLLLKIERIEHHPLHLSVYDVADGLEGIYIKNSFREQVSQEVLSDVVEDINIPGVPQVKGVKNVFQRNNRNVKVTVKNNYKVVLKAFEG